MSSALADEWHLVPLRHDSFRQPSVCGGFVTGFVHRRLLRGPSDLPGEPKCAQCVAAVFPPGARRFSGSIEPPG